MWAVTTKWKSSLKGILQKMLLSLFKVGKIRAYLQVEEKQRQEKHRADEGPRGEREGWTRAWEGSTLGRNIHF